MSFNKTRYLKIIIFFKVIYFHVFSHLAMRQVQDAANLLARRYNQSSLRTSSHVCLIAKDKQQGLVYAQKVVQQYLLQYQWKEAYSFLREDKHLQVSSQKPLPISLSLVKIVSG
jgi:hypothetical protein